jgi:hypothetical protein
LETNGPTINEAVALDSILQTRDMFWVINSSNLFNPPLDPNTRLVIFVGNLQLQAGEQSSVVTINLVDNNGQTYDVAAEDVRPLVGLTFVQVSFRLPTGLSPGICTIKVLAHNQTSNIGTIRIQP